MRKLTARWVSRLLTIHRKHNRVTTSEECFVLLDRNPDEFLACSIPLDQTWNNHFTTTFRRSSNSRNSMFLRSNRLRRWLRSAQKEMASVFCGIGDKVHICYPSRAKNYHLRILCKLTELVQWWYKGKMTYEHQENARLLQQSMEAHMHSCYGDILSIGFRIALNFTTLSGLSPQWHFPLPRKRNSECSLNPIPQFFQRILHRKNSGIFSRSFNAIFQLKFISLNKFKHFKII